LRIKNRATAGQLVFQLGGRKGVSSGTQGRGDTKLSKRI
jgi:hypothetical protein